MIESEIDRGIFVPRIEAERTAFHQLIDRYISEIAAKHKGAYSEIKRLEALKRHPLATRIVATLTARAISAALPIGAPHLAAETGHRRDHYHPPKGELSQSLLCS